MDLITDRLNNFMQYHESREQKVTEQQAPSALASSTTPSNQGLLPDIVNISDEGKIKAAANPEKPIWQSLHKLATNEQQQIQAPKRDAKQGSVDAAIKKLQKQIDELKQRMEALKNKEDEASKKQLEMLETELMALTAQLMELNNQKLEQLKADKL